MAAGDTLTKNNEHDHAVHYILKRHGYQGGLTRADHDLMEQIMQKFSDYSNLRCRLKLIDKLYKEAIDVKRIWRRGHRP